MTNDALVEEKDVSNITIFNVDNELIDAFKEFARVHGITRLSDALKLLLSLSESNFLFAKIFEELDGLKKEVIQLKKVEDNSGVVTFGGKIK